MDTTAAPDRGATLRASLLVGIAAMAAMDEIVFHQLLQWHHFYDRATPAWGLFADGLLHAFELVAMAAGFVWLLRLRGRSAMHRPTAWAGFLLGLGAFQLFDGLVDHKVLRTHQIRYGVDLLPYDLTWNGAAVVMLAVGTVLLRRARREA